MNTDIGTLVQAFFTLAMLSFVFKENVASKFSEHVYIGLQAGYSVVIVYFNHVRPTFTDKIVGNGEWWYVFPIIIGLLVYTRFVKSIAWMSRYYMAFVLGVGSGYVLSKDFKPFFVDQVSATFLKLWGTGDWWLSLSNLIFVIGTMTSVAYFFFTPKRKGVMAVVPSIGRITMMVAFGAGFGNTVMARVSLLLGRFQFLLGDWLGVIKY